jgi:hypothetical protein
MSPVTEKVEISYGETHWLLPQTEIPFLYTRNICTHEGEYSKEYQYNA